MIRTGARKLIGKAVDAELTTMLEHYADLKAPDNRQAVVRNGYLPRRKVHGPIGVNSRNGK